MNRLTQLMFQLRTIAQQPGTIWKLVTAMKGILSNEQLRSAMLQDMKHDGTTHDNYIAFHSVRYADQLIKQLEQ